MPEASTTPYIDTSLAAAASKIEGLLDLGATGPQPIATPPRAPKQAAPPQPEPEEVEAAEEEFADEADPALDEDPTSEETDEGREELDSPTIEPPSYWTSKEKAVFGKLQPEAQEIILRKESERNNSLAQKMKAVAEEKQAIDAQLSKVQHVEANYAAQVQQLLALTIPEFKKFEGVNLVQLAQEDPTRAFQIKTEWEALNQRVGYMQQELNRVQQASQQQNITRLQNYAVEQYHKAIEEIPDLADDTKRESKVNRMKAAARSFGFSDQELDNLHDARVLKVLDYLERAVHAENTRKQAQAKKTSAPAPKLMQPNAAPERDTSPKPRLDRDMAKLKKTGSMKDAVRLLERHLNQ